MMATGVILRTVLERVELEPDRTEAERIVRRNFTLGPERGARVIVQRRLSERKSLPSAAADPLV
jgi:hypothetical protein